MLALEVELRTICLSNLRRGDHVVRVIIRNLRLIAVTALLSSSLTLAGSWVIFSGSSEVTSFAAKTSGKVALTETELLLLTVMVRRFITTRPSQRISI